MCHVNKHISMKIKYALIHLEPYFHVTGKKKVHIFLDDMFKKNYLIDTDYDILKNMFKVETDYFSMLINRIVPPVLKSGNR